MTNVKAVNAKMQMTVWAGVKDITRHRKTVKVNTGGVVPTLLSRALKNGYVMYFWYFIKDPDFAIQTPHHCWLLFDVRWLEEIDQMAWVERFTNDLDGEMRAVVEIVNRHEVFPVYWERKKLENAGMRPTAEQQDCCCGAPKTKWWKWMPIKHLWICRNCGRRYDAEYYVPQEKANECVGIADAQLPSSA